MQFNSKKTIFGFLIVASLAGCQKEQGVTQAQLKGKESPPVLQPSVVTPKPVVYEGPFGLKMGLSVEEVKKVISGVSQLEESEWIYRASSVPIPHPNFESYSLRFSKKTGLCRIAAVGKEIKSGESGMEVRSDFDSLDESLTKKYGKGKKYDFSSSRHESSEYWMLHLLKNNRKLGKIWSKEEGSVLSNNLSSIFLQAKASSLSTGYMVLSYEFENMSDCVEEEESNKNKGL